MGVCALAVLVPVHKLDRKIGPLAFSSMTLHEFSKAVREDHGMLVLVDPKLRTNVVAFSVDRPTSRREVLEKVAAQTGLSPALESVHPLPHYCLDVIRPYT